MNFIIPIVTFVLCLIALYVFYNDACKNPLEEGLDEKSRFLKSAKIYSIVLIIITMLVSIVFITVYKDNSIYVSLKRMAMLSMLWPIAYIDYKTMRIPNSFIILGLSYRVILLPVELLGIGKVAWYTLLTELIAAVALFIASMLCAVLIKNSIGFGDIKLFIVMGFLLGLDGIWGAMFASLFISFIIAVFLLATKKKGRKDTIPFGPAIVIGTYLSVILTGM